MKIKTERKYLLALDAGIGGGRCVIADVNGNEVSSSYQEWDYIYPNIPGGVEFNADHFWSILCSQIRKATSEAGISPSQIKGISATAQRETSIFFDEEKEILSIPCTDTRLQSDISHILIDHGKKMKEIAGRFPSGQGQTLLRLWWLKKYRSGTLKKIRHVLTMNDWMLYRLSGKFTAEPSNATHTGALNIHTREWSKDLLEILDLPTYIWPEICWSGEQIGEVTSRAEEETGLEKGTPIVSGGADAQCGALGTATTSEGQIVAIAGTTTPILIIVDKPVIDSNVNVNCHVVADKWVLESNAGSTGIILRYFRDEFADLENIVERETELSAYYLLDRKAEKVPLGSEGLFSFLASRIPGEPFPTGSIVDTEPRRWPPQLKGKKELWRALLENICYGVRANIENLEKTSKTKISELRICGGQSRSRILMQIQADVIGKPVWIPKVKEATSFGAIICAGVGAGFYDNLSDAAEKLVKTESTVEPNDRNHQIYSNLFEQWKKTSKKLSET